MLRRASPADSGRSIEHKGCMRGRGDPGSLVFADNGGGEI
jgi:hypothetical protein